MNGDITFLFSPSELRHDLHSLPEKTKTCPLTEIDFFIAGGGGGFAITRGEVEFTHIPRSCPRIVDCQMSTRKVPR